MLEAGQRKSATQTHNDRSFTLHYKPWPTVHGLLYNGPTQCQLIVKESNGKKVMSIAHEYNGRTPRYLENGWENSHNFRSREYWNKEYRTFSYTTYGRQWTPSLRCRPYQNPFITRFYIVAVRTLNVLSSWTNRSRSYLCKNEWKSLWTGSDRGRNDVQQPAKIKTVQVGDNWWPRQTLVPTSLKTNS